MHIIAEMRRLSRLNFRVQHFVQYMIQQLQLTDELGTQKTC